MWYQGWNPAPPCVRHRLLFTELSLRPAFLPCLFTLSLCPTFGYFVCLIGVHIQLLLEIMLATY